jgi:hypothetical protein
MQQAMGETGTTHTEFLLEVLMENEDTTTIEFSEE